MGAGEDTTPTKPSKPTSSAQVLSLSFSLFLSLSLSLSHTHTLMHVFTIVLGVHRKCQRRPHILSGRALCRFVTKIYRVQLCHCVLMNLSVRELVKGSIAHSRAAPFLGLLWSWSYTTSLFCSLCCFSNSPSISVGKPGDVDNYDFLK